MGRDDADRGGRWQDREEESK
ncbi:uncharacterized protein G2W53_002427 [Senna tora]|uniref:Uncharacterized protein n=1 Tax=Senna tora TaxID=362788 RepID=A0A835CNG5_9FABA|nr:uncharacterized protein G2W53_002427 [Senna tora]